MTVLSIPHHALAHVVASRRVRVGPRTDFYLRYAPGAEAATLTATTSGYLSGRVQTGVALAGPARRLTPVALTTPRHVTMEFDISWGADRARTHMVGECG